MRLAPKMSTSGKPSRSKSVSLMDTGRMLPMGLFWTIAYVPTGCFLSTEIALACVSNSRISLTLSPSRSTAATHAMVEDG